MARIDEVERLLDRTIEQGVLLERRVVALEIANAKEEGWYDRDAEDRRQQHRKKKQLSEWAFEIAKLILAGVVAIALQAWVGG